MKIKNKKSKDLKLKTKILNLYNQIFIFTFKNIYIRCVNFKIKITISVNIPFQKNGA